MVDEDEWKCGPDQGRGTYDLSVTPGKGLPDQYLAKEDSLCRRRQQLGALQGVFHSDLKLLCRRWFFDLPESPVLGPRSRFRPY